MSELRAVIGGSAAGGQPSELPPGWLEPDLAFNRHIDGLDGSRWTYRNALGTTASTRSDTSAFACSQ